MVEDGLVESQIADGIGRVTFSHPRSNSLPGKLLREIAAKIDTFGSDAKVRVIVLQSAGEKAFCAGASFDELAAVKNLDESKHFFSGFAILIAAMRRCPKFVVTRLQGKAVGGGVGVVSASDYAFAHDSASIRLSELALGFGPFIIGPAVQRKVGLSAFTELAVDADWRDAGWAKSHGLYNEVVASHSELDAKVNNFAAKLAAYNPAATSKLKAILWEGTEHWEQLLENRVHTTSSLALTDFVQKAIKVAQAK